MNIMTAHALSRRLPSTITVNAVHPGIAETKLLRASVDMKGASPEHAAHTVVFAAMEKVLSKMTGRYFADSAETPCAPHADDERLEEFLYRRSCELTGATPLAPCVTEVFAATESPR